MIGYLRQCTHLYWEHTPGGYNLHHRVVCIHALTLGCVGMGKMCPWLTYSDGCAVCSSHTSHGTLTHFIQTLNIESYFLLTIDVAAAYNH